MTSYSKRPKRVPHSLQVVVTGPEVCPHCDCPVTGTIITTAVDQTFDPNMLNIEALCRSCEKEFAPTYAVEFKPLVLAKEEQTPGAA